MVSTSGVTLTAGSQLVLLAASVVLLWLAVQTYREQPRPLKQGVSSLFGLLGVTALCLGLTAATGTLNKLIWLGTHLSIPLVLLGFSASYYGYAVFASRLRTAAVVTPAVLGGIGGSLLILGSPEVTESTVAALTSVPETVFQLAAAFDTVGMYYAAGLVLVAVGLVSVNVVRYEHLDARLAAAIGFIGAWPWVANAVLPALETAIGEGASLVVLAGGYATSAAVAVAVVGPLGLLAASPAAGNVGSEYVLDSMSDAVFIVDDTSRLLRLNQAAVDRFGVTESAAVGQSVETVFGKPTAEITDKEMVSLTTVDGVRQFSVTHAPVIDGHECRRGTVVVLRDVTTQQTQKQRLEVLNRVLRHNLRNNANAIIARAELLSEESDSADQIVETTQKLVGVAETARDIESMMETESAETSTAITKTVDRVIDRVSPTSAEITTAVPRKATAAVDSDTLETVLFHLVDNAIEHNDSDEPLVVVSVDADDDGEIRIAVSDNGPGIPAHEQRVLTAGEENQLEHGSGLGLWAVSWGVTQMGGTFDISDNEPRGTTVTICLPNVAATLETEDAERVELDTETVAVDSGRAVPAESADD